MNIEEYRQICLGFKGVTEDFPFDNKTLTFKLMGKMFSAIDVENFERINLKCDPERALELRESYSGIKPGYHMNKKHWNSVFIPSDVSIELLVELTNHSYSLVKASLTKAQKTELEEL